MKPDLPTNLLALAVLSFLKERPMHPYEIAFTMRERHLEHSIKLNFGSLYHTIESLASSGWIAPVETARDGRRPEKTVYALTNAGRVRLLDWLRELIRTPVKDYLRFEAGLSFMNDLGREEAVSLLRERAKKLGGEAESWRVVMEKVIGEQGIPRLFLLELEHAQALRQAELEWIKRTADEIEDGRLEFPQAVPQEGEVKT
jgi:DNA-binding PadR family transcriptional regulator